MTSGQGSEVGRHPIGWRERTVSLQVVSMADGAMLRKQFGPGRDRLRRFRRLLHLLFLRATEANHQTRQQAHSEQLAESSKDHELLHWGCSTSDPLKTSVMIQLEAWKANVEGPTSRIGDDKYSIARSTASRAVVP